MFFFFFFQAEDGIRDYKVTGVQTCALPIFGEGGEGGKGTDRPGVCGGCSEGGCHSRGNRCRPQNGRGILRGADRKSVVEGKRVDLGGRRIIKKKKRIVQVVEELLLKRSTVK